MGPRAVYYLHLMFEMILHLHGTEYTEYQLPRIVSDKSIRENKLGQIAQYLLPRTCTHGQVYSLN